MVGDSWGCGESGTTGRAFHRRSHARPPRLFDFRGRSTHALIAPSSPIAIVGLGPVGALLANLLGERGVRVVVFERAPAPFGLPRAAHLDDDAMRVLQSAGVANAAAAGAREIDGMDVVDARGRRLIRARKREGLAGWPPANLVHQPDVETALRAGLARYPHVEVRLGHEVERVVPGSAGATLHVCRARGLYTDRASWVVGCDGARSVVRGALGGRMRAPGIPFEERWLVIDTVLRHPVELPDRLVQVADPRRPTTYVPFEGRRRRWEFRLRAGEDADEMTKPGVVAALLRPHVDPAAVDIERAAVYGFVGAIASRWRRGRLLLAGDAAHVMPPFIGQGLCAGIRDAAFLGWALSAVAAGRSPEGLLDLYERERRPHVAAAARLSIRAGRFVGMRTLGAFARDGLISFARRWPALEHRLDSVEKGPPSITSTLAGTGGRPLRSLPQPWVETRAGERLRLDDALGSGWAVLGLALDPRAWAGDHPAWAAAGARFLRVLVEGEAHHSGAPAVRDPTNALARWAGRAGWVGRAPLALVVRPDRFVFGLYGGGAGRRAAAELAKWFVVG